MIDSTAPEPRRGEVWMADLNPVMGREQAGVRPILVLSVDPFNQSRAELVIALPLTSKDKDYPHHVVVIPPEGGLSVMSYIKCEDVRSISKERLTTRRGVVSSSTMSAVENVARLLLGL